MSVHCEALTPLRYSVEPAAVKGAGTITRTWYQDLILLSIPGGWSIARGTECNCANPFRKAGADSASSSGPHFSLVRNDPAHLSRCRVLLLGIGTMPGAGAWALSILCAPHGKGHLGQPAHYLWDPAGPWAAPYPAVWREAGDSEGGAGLQIAFEQDGLYEYVSVLQKPCLWDCLC